MSPTAQQENKTTVYTAPWVLPVSSPPIKEGAVAVRAGRILWVGGRDEAAARFAGSACEECAGLLMPALVNAHIHLELSWLGNMPEPGPRDDMTDWIGMLLEKRHTAYPGDEKVRAAAARELADQYRAGVALLADIGNARETRADAGDDLPEVLAVHEVLAPTVLLASEVLGELKDLPPELPVSPHAPYSTAPTLIQATKQRCRKHDQLFSIHAAESREEVIFLREKSGPFRTFLEKRGMWDGALQELGNHSGTIIYLDDLGVLDERTLCVHCVHIGTREIGILARRGAKVCLCPGSNRRLGVGDAPLEEMLAAGLLPALGTDSITSNEVLDLWREIALLRSLHPRIGAATFLAMATLGGAQALGRENDYGTLAEGKRADFLEIEFKTAADDPGQLEEELASGGRPSAMRWLRG